MTMLKTPEMTHYNVIIIITVIRNIIDFTKTSS